MSIQEESLRLHEAWRGKIEVITRAPLQTKEDLSLAYTPGVAAPCLEISRDVNRSFALTRRANLVAVVTDGTAVLGLGDIGPEAGMPVMEGKCALFKTFADVDAFPLCIKSHDVDEIVRTIYLLSGSFGGINLEDISAPRCFEIERRLQALCDIPVFHDDQHGTAIVAGAALLNALKLVGKEIGQVRCVVNGAGSAGLAVSKHLYQLGLTNQVLVGRHGVLSPDTPNINAEQLAMVRLVNPEGISGTLRDAMVGADVFLGLSVPNVLTADMVATMRKDAIVFPMANPTPEILPEEALAGGARIVGTGRSDYPNQINNVLAFPGVFRGALDCRATCINDEMKLAASHAIADLIPERELREDYIIPDPFDRRVARAVADAIIETAKKTGVQRKA
ncbi:MAG: malic enzyme-like NAD(P)-binding protein [Eubacteriales bacterium]